jgi:hypothetical protein
MTYKFNASTEVPLNLTDFDLATTATLDLGIVSVTPTGEMNDEQLTAALTAITAAIKTTTGVDATVSLHSIES